MPVIVAQKGKKSMAELDFKVLLWINLICC